MSPKERKNPFASLGQTQRTRALHELDPDVAVELVVCREKDVRLA
jgi:hypothetical protein